MLKRPVVLYDGECAFCRRRADRIRERDRSQALAVIPAADRNQVMGLPFLEPAALNRSVHVVLPGGVVLVGGQAIPVILEQLPRWRWLAAGLRLPGANRAAEAVYRWTARHRHRLD